MNKKSKNTIFLMLLVFMGVAGAINILSSKNTATYREKILKATEREKGNFNIISLIKRKPRCNPFREECRNAAPGPVWVDATKKEVNKYLGKKLSDIIPLQAIKEISTYGAVDKYDFMPVDIDKNDALFANLIKNGYIDARGVIQTGFKKISDYSKLRLDSAYDSEKKEIYEVLRRVLVAQVSDETIQQIFSKGHIIKDPNIHHAGFIVTIIHTVNKGTFHIVMTSDSHRWRLIFPNGKRFWFEF